MVVTPTGTVADGGPVRQHHRAVYLRRGGHPERHHLQLHHAKRPGRSADMGWSPCPRRRSEAGNVTPAIWQPAGPIRYPSLFRRIAGAVIKIPSYVGAYADYKKGDVNRAGAVARVVAGTIVGVGFSAMGFEGEKSVNAFKKSCSITKEAWNAIKTKFSRNALRSAKKCRQGYTYCWEVCG